MDRKSRAVLLPTTAWPFIIRLWLENFKTWEDKVDKVYLALGDNTKPEFITSLKTQISKMQMSDKVTIVITNSGWIDSYTDAYKASTEDLVMIMHDDTYINDPEMVDKNFKLAEEGKVVAAMWDAYGPKEEVEEWLRQTYPGVFPTGTGNEKYGFVLNLIFISRINMDKTSVNFNGGNIWPDKEGWGVDVGFRFMLELLDNKVEIYPLKRYHFEMEEKGDYIHLGNMASSIPPIFEGNDLPTFNWDIPKFKIKLELIEKALLLDDYEDIPEYRDKIKDRITELRKYL